MTTRDTEPTEPTVRAIISAARSVPVQTRSRGAWITAGLSGLLLWASFPPLDWGPLGWIALVPLLLLIRPVQRPRATLVATFVCGFVAQLFMLQWLRYGDATMYPAWIALAVYTALYFPVFVLLSRAAVHRFRVPFTLAVPTIWVGLEFLRAHLMTGFSWYYLGHTQYRWIELIQISDLVGAYGVSFIVAASSAALAASLPESLLRRFGLVPRSDLGVQHDLDTPNDAGPLANDAPFLNRRTILAVGFAVGLVVASLIYGFVRRSQAEFTTGPRIALIQGNFTTQVKHDPSEAFSIFNRHYVMTGAAVKYQPDVIVWPETMYRNPLLLKSPDVSDAELLRLTPYISAAAWKSSQVPEALHDLSRQAGASLIIGIDTLVADPGSVKHFNSAVLTVPDRGVVSRYDKMHRVIFGEYIPLKDALPFLRSFVPYGAGFGIDAGSEAKVFKCKDWRLVPLVCFEDTVPHLVRGIVSQLNDPAEGKPVDCLVNLTNDGWFHGSAGLDQHLITSLFRCVECRKPMVRAVNTGISAVIDGDGMVVEPDVFLDVDNKGRTTMRDPKSGRWNRQFNAVLVDSVPLDNRTSLYLRFGDWFAGTCGFATLLVLLASLVPRRWTSRRQQPTSFAADAVL
jgi:apolipoprotein N-acyltransferase